MRLVLDDFGTGYSSLAAPRDFPIDMIKIDRSFVAEPRALDAGRRDRRVGHLDGAALGLGVVAEGVESETQARAAARARLPDGAGLLLRRAGVRRPATGYSVAVATPGAQMSAEMAEQPAVLRSLLERRAEIRERVRPLGEPAPPGIVLVARGSSDNAAIYGRYLLELVVGRPVALAAPSVFTLYGAHVDCRGWLAVALSQSGATPEIVGRLRAACGRRARAGSRSPTTPARRSPRGDAVSSSARARSARCRPPRRSSRSWRRSR